MDDGHLQQSPDRSPMELKTFEDWVVEPALKSVPGVADDSGFGGGAMQYQVLFDPNKLAGVGLSVDVRLAGDPTTYSSDHQSSDWSVNRDVPAATTVELPVGTTPADTTTAPTRSAEPENTEVPT